VRISPIDIQQKQFKSRPFGYEKAGVDQFLEILADELERLLRKNQDLQEELDRSNAMLSEMREREEMLKETLLTTQRVTEELKSTARREVDVMMAEAEVKAERLMHNAEERRQQLIQEIQEIKRQKIDFEVNLRGLLERHIRMLDLNNVAVAQQHADARLLEEPLPFAKYAEQKAAASGAAPAGCAYGSVEDAEFTERDEPHNPHGGAKAPELSFDFEPGNGNGEEDLLK